MHEISLSADELTRVLLTVADTERVCILDSCGVGHLGSHLLIAGIVPLELLEVSHDDPVESLRIFDEKLAAPNLAAIFTISYDFGLKLQRIEPREKEFESLPEPDIFIALFDCLVVHDYDKRMTFVSGNDTKFAEIADLLSRAKDSDSNITSKQGESTFATSNFSKSAYLESAEGIKELIRSGDTYQTNLTQQLTVKLSNELTAAEIFSRLRQDHPAPFAAFVNRKDSAVISASPERFIRIDTVGCVSASPIKGTRPRGKTAEEDNRLKMELLNSEKDRAENTMIVDLLRNDIGRICKFGSVTVEKLCDLEEHPTLFHLVSTVGGVLRNDISYADIIEAVFPCGSITGAPKIRTMQIIDRLETVNRGLSMGAIGYRIPESGFGITGGCDMSVAIRTMVIRDRQAIFNVGGGIVIDSDPEKEYEEAMLKAKALLNALGSEFL